MCVRALACVCVGGGQGKNVPECILLSNRQTRLPDKCILLAFNEYLIFFILNSQYYFLSSRMF